MKIKKDSLGMIFSALCGVHCLVTPLILLMPFAHDLFAPFHHNHEMIHVILFVLVFPLALTVVNKALKLNMNAMLAAALIGIFFLSLSVVNNFVHFFEHESIGEVSLALVGSLFLVWAHFKSLRTCKIS
jgi:hypothetical protein